MTRSLKEVRELPEFIEIQRRVEEITIELVHSYSGGTNIWQESGNNFNKLLKKAADEVTMYNFIAEAGGDGMYLDRRVNAVGATGWDFLAGKRFPWE